MALEIGGIPYENLSVQDYFGKAWSDAKKESPFGQVPLLVVNDNLPLAQSGAIMRYIAQTIVPSLTPDDPMSAARCDQFFEASQELVTPPTNVNKIVNIFRGEEFKERKASYFELALPKLVNLEKALETAPSGGPFFLGRTLYYCDLGLFHVLDNTRTLEPSVLDSFPKLKAFMAAVEAHPAVAKYLINRPDVVDVGSAPMLKSK